MTKWIVSTPLKGTNLMKNFVCFTEVELRKLLEQYPDATVEMKDSHLEDHAPLPLTDDQQVVLEWLKNLYGCHYYQPFVAVSLFRHSFWTEKIEENYNQLDRKQQAQVLEVFSRWALEQEEEK